MIVFDGCIDDPSCQGRDYFSCQSQIGTQPRINGQCPHQRSSFTLQLIASLPQRSTGMRPGLPQGCAEEGGFDLDDKHDPVHGTNQIDLTGVTVGVSIGQPYILVISTGRSGNELRPFAERCASYRFGSDVALGAGKPLPSLTERRDRAVSVIRTNRPWLTRCVSSGPSLLLCSCNQTISDRSGHGSK